MYDFSRCKLCGKQTASPKYTLKEALVYACSACDFHAIDALDVYPAEQPETILLTDKARSFIESKLPQNARQLTESLKFIKSHMELSGKHCLDIGTGVGLFLSMLQDEGALTEGIEPQQIFREFAREKYQITLHRDLIDAPYWQDERAGTFDVVTLWDTLEHVNFPAETIEAAGKILKPGGYLFLDTPSRDSFVYRFSEWSYRVSMGAKPLLLNSLYSPKPYRHKQIFTKAQLRSLLESAGFGIVGRSTFHRAGNKLVVACQKKSASAT